MQVHIIGIPGTVQRFLEAEFRGEPRVSGTRMAINKKGEPVLVPVPDEAVRVLQRVFDEVEHPSGLRVVLLSYTPVPSQLEEELVALTEMGAEVLRPIPGTDRWPKYSRDKKLDKEFQDSLFRSLVRLISCGRSELPSKYFADARLRSSRFVVAEGAITCVDEIAHHRFSFVERAVSALEEIADGCNIGSFDKFFTAKGLNFAASGGITVTPEVWRNGKRVASQPTNHHLKQGDGTTRVAAVRLYFDVIQDGDDRFVVVLYAGPHPDKDLTRRVELPGSER